VQEEYSRKSRARLGLVLKNQNDVNRRPFLTATISCLLASRTRLSVIQKTGDISSRLVVDRLAPQFRGESNAYAKYRSQQNEIDRHGHGEENHSCELSAFIARS